MIRFHGNKILNKMHNNDTTLSKHKRAHVGHCQRFYQFFYLLRKRIIALTNYNACYTNLSESQANAHILETFH